MIGEKAERCLEFIFRQVPEGFALAELEGQFKAAAFQMLDQDLGIVRIDPRMFDRGRDQLLGRARDKLIKGHARSHHDAHSRLFATPRATKALHRSCERSRITCAHDRIEGTDIDAKLKRVCRNDAADISLPQSSLDLAPLIRQIPAAIGVHPIRIEARILLQTVTQILEHDLDRVPALPKDQRRNIRADQVFRETHRRFDIARAHPKLGVNDGRVVEHDAPRPARCAALRDHLRGLAENLRRMLARVSDRRRRRNKGWVRPMKMADAPQPSEHVREVRTKDAAIGV